MRGHEHIIARRLDGYAPSIVFVNDYPCKTDWFEHQEHATVCTAFDSLTSLDLRFLVGLRVCINATTEERAKALFERSKAEGAAVVAASHTQVGVSVFEQSGWTEIYHKRAA